MAEKVKYIGGDYPRGMYEVDHYCDDIQMWLLVGKLFPGHRFLAGSDEVVIKDHEKVEEVSLF